MAGDNGPTTQKVHPPRARGLLWILFVALAAALSALIPLGEAADEVSHQSYVRYVAEYGGLPPVVAGTTVLGETFQPPLYYALAAPLTAWLPRGEETNLGFSNPVENNPDWELGNPARARLLLQPAAARWPWRGEALGWHLVRFFSVLLGAATVALTYALGRVVFPDEPWTALLAAALVAFLPSFLGLSAAVTNDALATTLGALLLWQLARLVAAEETGWRGWAIAGALGALGVWTKASGWVFVGTVSLAALLRATDGRGPLLPQLARTLGAAGLAWALVVLPLAAINLERSGDLLGRGVQAQVTEARPTLSVAEGVGLIRGAYRTWWAGFGGAVHLHFPPWVEAALLLPLLLAGWGLVRGAPAWGAARRVMALLAAHAAMVGAAWLLWSRLVMGTGQGRLLFPALPALALLAAAGLVRASRGAPQRAALGWGVGALGLALLALVTLVLPTYRAVALAPPAPEGAMQERWQVGESALALTAFHLPWTVDSRTPPGSEAPLYVAWEATRPLPDLRLRLRWVDSEGVAPAAAKEGSPLAAPPLTDEWERGTYAALHRVRLPEGAAPGWYRLMLSVIDPQSGEPLPLHGPGGSMGTEIMVGQTTVVE